MIASSSSRPPFQAAAMHFPAWLTVLLPIIPGALAVSPVQRLRSTRPHVFADSHERRNAIERRNTDFFTPKFSNPKAATFHVNSSALPLVTFPLQDSWAGRLPITNSTKEERVCPLSVSRCIILDILWNHSNCSSGTGHQTRTRKVTSSPFGSTAVQDAAPWEAFCRYEIRGVAHQQA